MFAVVSSWRVSPLTRHRMPERLRIGDLVGGDDPRPHRRERVERLAAGPLRVAELQVAGGDVVAARVPEHVVERVAPRRRGARSADHRDELGFVVERVRDRREHDVDPGADDRVRPLGEQLRLGRHRGAGLGRVLGVVAPDAHDLARARDRRDERDARRAGRRPRPAPGPTAWCPASRTSSPSTIPARIDAVVAAVRADPHVLSQTSVSIRQSSAWLSRTTVSARALLDEHRGVAAAGDVAGDRVPRSALDALRPHRARRPRCRGSRTSVQLAEVDAPPPGAHAVARRPRARSTPVRRIAAEVVADVVVLDDVTRAADEVEADAPADAVLAVRPDRDLVAAERPEVPAVDLVVDDPVAAAAAELQRLRACSRGSRCRRRSS